MAAPISACRETRRTDGRLRAWASPSATKAAPTPALVRYQWVRLGKRGSLLHTRSICASGLGLRTNCRLDLSDPGLTVRLSRHKERIS